MKVGNISLTLFRVHFCNNCIIFTLFFFFWLNPTSVFMLRHLHTSISTCCFDSILTFPPTVLSCSLMLEFLNKVSPILFVSSHFSLRFVKYFTRENNKHWPASLSQRLLKPSPHTPPVSPVNPFCHMLIMCPLALFHLHS